MFEDQIQDVINSFATAHGCSRAMAWHQVMGNIIADRNNGLSLLSADDQPRDEMGRWTDVSSSAPLRSPTQASLDAQRTRVAKVLASPRTGGLGGAMYDKYGKGSPAEIDSRIESEALYQDARAAVAATYPSISLLSPSSKPYAIVEPDVMRDLRTEAKPFSVRVFQSFSVKDKLKALGFRFDGAEKTWVKSVARPEHAKDAIGDIEHSGIFAGR